jgi:hypothetical protein
VAGFALYHVTRPVLKNLWLSVFGPTPVCYAGERPFTQDLLLYEDMGGALNEVPVFSPGRSGWTSSCWRSSTPTPTWRGRDPDMP